MEKKFTYNGIEYPSLKAFCKAHGLNYGSFFQVYRKLGSIEKAIIHFEKREYAYFYMGKYYKSLATLCKDHGVNHRLFNYYYYKKHQTLETALANSKRSRSFIYDGTKYPSIRAFCAKHGLNYQSFCRVYKKTGSIEETVDHFTKRPYIYKGKEYRSLIELCKDCHVEYSRFYYYYYTKHETIGTAIANSKQAKGAAQKIQYRGVSYPSLLAFCKENNLTYSMMQINLKSMSLEEAVEKTKRTTRRQKPAHYKNCVELCEKNGISYWSFMSARRRGLSDEDAIAYCKKGRRNL